MSSSPAQRKKAAKMNTPENIKKWDRQFRNAWGIGHGDKIKLMEPIYQYEKGDIFLCQIYMDSRTWEPTMALVSEKDNMSFCGPTPYMKWEKV